MCSNVVDADDIIGVEVVDGVIVCGICVFDDDGVGVAVCDDVVGGLCHYAGGDVGVIGVVVVVGIVVGWVV